VSGRLTLAACGHPGRFVIGQYIECLSRNCDGIKRCTPPCAVCGSFATRPFVTEGMPDKAWACDPCGKVFWSWAHVIAAD
jgi:hypothetical protein